MMPKAAASMPLRRPLAPLSFRQALCTKPVVSYHWRLVRPGLQLQSPISMPAALHPFINSRPFASTTTSSSANAREAYQKARQAEFSRRNKNLGLYTAAILLLSLGLSYAAVPLYRIFCSATGMGGTPMTTQGGESNNAKFAADRLVPRTDGGLSGEAARQIRVHFNADKSDSLPWTFSPSQKDVTVLPGETALAFYRARNKSQEDIVGIATYNVMPEKIAPYFAKVECFCFEEQKILAGEEVDLPVFFFIDRDFVDDPTLKDVDDVVLSYTFFRAKRNKYGDLVPVDSKSS